LALRANHWSKRRTAGSTIGLNAEGVRESGDPPVIVEDLSLEPSDYYELPDATSITGV
jgi:hypothetical protein